MPLPLNLSIEKPSVILLIIEKEKHLEKTEQYMKLLEIDDVITVDNIDEAECFLSKDENKQTIVLLDDIIIENGGATTIDKLKKLKLLFKGNIILKVHDENIGLELLKAKVINEYFLANNDPIIEEKNFLQSLKITKLKSRIKSTLKDTVNSVNEITKNLGL